MIRQVMNVIIVLGLACIPLGMFYRDHSQSALDDEVNSTREAIKVIYNRSMYHGSLGDVKVNGRNFPVEIKSDWFDSPPPNTLIDDHIPWIAKADESEKSLLHPRNKVADQTTSSFWYNPYLGVIRARVPSQHTDQATEQLYYRVNQSTDDE